MLPKFEPIISVVQCQHATTVLRMPLFTMPLKIAYSAYY
jgi:hypothetical protein